MLSFLGPTRAKVIFCVEWTLFIGIQLLRGELVSIHRVLVTVYPLLFFYLVGCVLASVAERRQQLAAGLKLPALAAALALADQLIKAGVVARIPLGESIPLVDGWLHLGHARNAQGSWLLSMWSVEANRLLLIAVVSVILLAAIPYHRGHVRVNGRSAWADVAFIGLFAGCASWLADMALRGHIVDYIALPGVVVADLKDILLAAGIAALFVESLGMREGGLAYTDGDDAKP